MIGLAKMACRLADKRVGRDRYEKKGIWIDGTPEYPGSNGPVPREVAASTFMWDSEKRAFGDRHAYEASYEYYQIIDRLSRGEKP